MCFLNVKEYSGLMIEQFTRNHKRRIKFFDCFQTFENEKLWKNESFQTAKLKWQTIHKKFKEKRNQLNVKTWDDNI